jgi:MSHA biogenesis protein MshJ
MKKLLADLVARIDALAQRERALVFVAVLALLLFIPFQFVIDPALGAIKGLKAQSAASQATVASLEPQVRDLETRLAINPDDEIRGRLAAIDAELAGIDASLARMQSGLVEPARMAEVVRTLVARHPRLQVVALRTLPAAPLVERPSGGSSPAGAPAVAPPGEAGLYRHGLELTLEGRYPDLMDYAAQLERMPTRVLWNRTRIDATGYPKVRMTLTVFTLGLDRTWLTL